jgi:hypothetical protein
MKRIRYQAALIPAIASMLGVTVPAHAEDRALLIGINRYQSPDVRPLHGTHNDVSAFHVLLTSRLGFKDQQILELKDQEATKAGILNALDQWVIKGSKPGDRVVVYYSGHGDQIDDEPNGDEREDHRDEALIAYDAARDGLNWVRDDDLDSRLRGLQGREVLAVFDSCHSGTVTRGGPGDDDAKVPAWKNGPSASRAALASSMPQTDAGFVRVGQNLSAFFAVAPQQIALEDKSDPTRIHGVFTGAFVEGLNGAADANHDGTISYAELFDFLRIRSKQYCEARQKSQGKCPLGLTPAKQFAEFRAGMNLLAFGKETTRSSFVDVPSSPELPAMAEPAQRQPSAPSKSGASAAVGKPSKTISKAHHAAHPQNVAQTAAAKPHKPGKAASESHLVPPRPHAQKVAKSTESVLAHGNEVGLQLSMEAYNREKRLCEKSDTGNRFSLGRSVCYRVHVPRTGKLVLFDVDSAGTTTLLYPNNAIPSDAPPPCRPLPETVDGGINVLIPDNCMGFEIKTQEPAGKGKVVAVLIEDKAVDIHDLMVSHRGLGRLGEQPQPLPPTPGPENWMALLRERLDRIFHDPDGTSREVRWSVTAVDYEIVR